jgi:hypothetical protein
MHIIQILKHVKFITLWHVEPLLGNDRKTSNYTTAVTRQRPVNSNRETAQFMLGCLAGHVGFVVDKVAGYLQVLQFSCNSHSSTAPHSSSIIQGWYKQAN